MTLTGTSAQDGYSVNLGVGFTEGLSLVFVTNCDGNSFKGKPITLIGATLGYAVQSTTKKPMPGPNTQFTLDTPTCLGITKPFNITLLTGSKYNGKITPFPDLNPFDGVSSFQLSICDPAVVTGDLVVASLGSVSGGSGGNAHIAFDPGSGAVIQPPPSLNPVASSMSFRLSSFAYLPMIEDKLSIGISIAGVPVFQTPSLGFTKYNIQPTVAVASIPATISAAKLPSPLCITVTSSNAASSGSLCTDPASHGLVNDSAYMCGSSTVPAEGCPTRDTTTATVAISETGYAGAFTVTAFGTAACERSLGYVYPLSISPAGGNGPSATFSFTAGSQVPGTPGVCQFDFVDANGQTVAFFPLL